MDLIIFNPSFVLTLCVITSCFYVISKSRKRSNKLPPGPHPLPIIGNLHQLGPSPHQSLAKLAKSYGPIMRIKLGSVTSIIISSPEIAREILQKHDHEFPDRKTLAAARALNHHEVSVACLPMGRKWRILRKICNEQMFTTQSLNAGRGLREESMRKLVDYVQACLASGRAVNISEAAFVTSLNLISNTLFSVDFADYGSGSCREYMEIVHALMISLGCPNLADLFPVLGDFDPQGIKKKAEVYFGKLLAIFDDIIDRRLELKSQSDYLVKKDLLEALLEIGEGDELLSREDVKHLLLDLFIAGTETSSSSVEWAMTELLRNPDTMSKAKNEFKAILGDSQVQESDISNLPYLKALIKETFRYHPPGPFLYRFKKDDESEHKISNYTIPKDALILINLWAVGRDPSVWSDPESFKPERFLGSEIDIKGLDFELIPFGSGRRMCPGLPLAYRMVHLMVATLVRNFDWRLEDGASADLRERFGLSLQKAVPLMAVPVKL